MIWMIRDILICCFQLYMLKDMGKSFLTRKSSSYGFSFLYSAIITAVIWAVNGMESTIANMIGIPICYAIVLLLAFDGSIWKKIIITCCFYLLAIVPEFIFAAATNAYGVQGQSNPFQNEMEKTLAIVLMKICTFFLVKCISYISRKKNCKEIENGLFTVLLLLPLATITILGGIYYTNIPFTEINKIALPVGAVLMAITNIFTFSIFDRLVENKEKAKKMEWLYKKSRAENNNLKYIAKIDDEHKSFLHDINRFICTAGELLQKGENKKVMAILNQLGLRIQNMREYEYCSNPILNSILSERKFAADNKGIRYKITLGEGLRLDFIEELDIISMIGNLLDNAIEAAEKVEEDGFVECRIYMANNNCFLMMEFENNFLIPPQIGKKGYISTKREPGNHGIGIHTMEKLVKQYHGLMKTENDEKIFKVNLMIPQKRSETPKLPK